MRVPCRIYADGRMMDVIRGEQSFTQVVNVAHLPGIVGYSWAMPDIHVGYGFPIGGVAATALYWRPWACYIINAFRGMHGSSKTSVKSGATHLRAGSLLLGVLWIVVSAACATAPPANVENICAIFEEKRGWYKAAKKSEKRWGTPKHVQMSIIRQESSFKFDAKPPRTKLLGFIPWKRPSDAYGYAQALDINERRRRH